MVFGNEEKSQRINDNNVTASIMKRKHIVMRVIIFTMIIVVLSGMYFDYAWNRYQEEASSNAIALANSIEVVMPQRQISKLSGSVEDLDKQEYGMIKQKLTQLLEVNNQIHFAYLLAERDDSIIILLDSKSPDSLDYSPPGQIYEETDDVFHEPFRTGETILIKPLTNHRGTRISILVPVKDSATGNVIAVFGTDYSVSEWYSQIWTHMIPDIVIIICIMLLSFSFLYAWIQYIKNKFLSKKLTISEAFYRSVFDEAPVGIAIIDNIGFVNQSEHYSLGFNKKFEQILGRSGSDLASINWMSITHPDDLQADLDKFEQFKDGKISSYSMKKRYIRPDRSHIWVNMTISAFYNKSMRDLNHICIIQDISESKKIEEQLEENSRKQTVLLSNLPGMAYRCNYDNEWTMQFVSNGCFELTGYSPESLIESRKLSYNDLIVPDYCEPLQEAWEHVLAKRAQLRYEYEIIAAGGKRKWVLEMGQGIFNEQGKVEALEGIVLDISERKEMENNLRYINEHDRWTGLYNRDYLESLLEKDCKQKKMSKRALVVINLSTVQLLTVNYGFNYTQILIKKVVDALGEYITDERILFKIYENQFTFYLNNYKDKNELIDFSVVLASDLKELFMNERVGGGIGIIEIDRGNEPGADLLLRRLLIASEKSINEFDEDFTACFYNEDLETSIKREGDIRQELAKIAISEDNDELFLEYQPILDLKTDSICGFEALARLQTKKLGLVSPLEFIPIAEKTKLIIPIGDKIILNAFCFLNKLRALGYEEISVSINISAIQMFRSDFVSNLFDMISEMHVNPQNICIEITESIFASDYGNINNIISKLRDKGLHIAIDDFGTGYSSLAREKELMVDSLKIDKYFIEKLIEENTDKAITGDIISMAHRLGHCAIAEGVEQEVQKQYLLKHGCDKIQGYLVSRPLDEKAAVELLAKKECFHSSCNSDDRQCKEGDTLER